MVDYGSQAPMNTTTVAIAVQRRWACHARTVLPADASVRQRCNVVLSACSVVYMWYMSRALCARKRGQRKQTNFTVRTYVQNRPHAEKPGKSPYPLPAGKNLREPATRATVLGSSSNLDHRFRTPSCVDVVLGFSLEMLV